MAINITNKIIGACIALMMEQYKERNDFELAGVLFTKREIVTCANKLFPERQSVPQSIGPKKIKEGLCSCSEKCLEAFFQLKYTNINDEILEKSINTQQIYEILSQNLPHGFFSINDFLEKYYEFAKSVQFFPQQKYVPLQGQKEYEVPRRLVWIAAAVLTYNEYHRTQSTNVRDYGFSVSEIANYAVFLNATPSDSGYTSNVNNCTKDSSRPIDSFLCQMSRKRRRIAQIGEVDSNRPDNLALDFKVNTILGIVSVQELIHFIDNVYNKFENTMPEVLPAINSEEDSYTDKFLEEVYMDVDSYEGLIALLERKKNIILQGAPGTGKTFCAKRLAYAFMEEEAQARVQTVQFHQGYSYEDFVEGYRPTETGYALQKGIFYDFCTKADADKEHDYFFIIDEMNRGNLSKIFGELFTLLEKGKRGEEIKLVYSGESFAVPNNVYIIGLMNTADRSLAMIDYALRRRFGFFTMKPGFDTDGFQQYMSEFEGVHFRKLIDEIKELNKAITNDSALGEGFCIGHSFFCELDSNNTAEEIKADLESVVENEIIPLLEEYWFDECENVKKWGEKLRSALG